MSGEVMETERSEPEVEVDGMMKLKTELEVE